MPGVHVALTVKAIRFEKADHAEAVRCAKAVKGTFYTGVHGEADWETTREIALGSHIVNTSYIYVLPGVPDDGSCIPLADEVPWTEEHERDRIERVDGYPSRFDIDGSTHEELINMLRHDIDIPASATNAESLRVLAKEYFGIDEVENPSSIK